MSFDFSKAYQVSLSSFKHLNAIRKPDIEINNFICTKEIQCLRVSKKGICISVDNNSNNTTDNDETTSNNEPENMQDVMENIPVNKNESNQEKEEIDNKEESTDN